MFISGKDRKGGCYFEFQFCKIDNPVKDNKVICDGVEHWKEDSLLIYDEDFDVFYKKYGCIFECALFPNGERGFFYCGINYYDINITISHFIIQNILLPHLISSLHIPHLHQYKSLFHNDSLKKLYLYL